MRDPRVDPRPGDWLSNGRFDVVIDGSYSEHRTGAPEGVLIRTFRVNEDRALSLTRVPLDVFRRDALKATVIAMGLP
ncbi:MAG: hypothetical protein VW547_13010 [Alphaproteobacteria bacterium]